MSPAEQPSAVVLSLVLFFFSSVILAKTEDTSKGYRIIHTSPQLFVSALYSPIPKHAKVPARMEKEVSRLNKYFRIKSKVIEGKTVTMEILPDVPLLGTAFEDSNAMTVKITLVKQTSTSYFFDVDLKTKLELVATMAVEPHPSGSLMTIAVKHPAAEPFLNSMVEKTIFSMGFLASTPEAAEKD